MVIISKRNCRRFYVSIILVTACWLALGTGLLFFYIHELAHPKQMKTKNELIPLLSLACYVLAGYGLYRYIKNAPQIQLGKDFISFNKQIFAKDKILNIELTGKQPFKYLMSFPMEAAKLTFEDGTTKYIFDCMYENTGEIKSFLKQVFIEGKDFVWSILPPIDKEIAANDFYETFKGNQFTSWRGIILWYMMAFAGYSWLNFTKNTTSLLSILILGTALLWFTLSSWLMSYFQVSDSFLLVKSHNFFWVNKAYRLDSIEEVVFETQGKMPNCLRVIFKDYSSRLYPASTLRDKHWLALKAKLESYGIKVRNECI